MVSVLVPVYNTDVREFVKQLGHQLDKNKILGEIICIDDYSENHYKALNAELNNMPFVEYIQLDQNVGRSKIRNMLAAKANNRWLLFVDGDSEIISDDYLKNYLQHTDKEDQLVYGGTAYGELPQNNAFYLHWLYGNKRECVSLAARRNNKYGTFKTNNFFISQHAFNQVGFNEELKGYGHEDTLFAKDLERAEINILHIDNPLQHNGLDTHEDFLIKQYNAIQNLAYLYKKGLVSDDIRLIKFYKRVKRLGMMMLVKLFYLKDEKKLIANLKSAHPDLGDLDRLKLKWFVNAVRR